MKCASIEIGNGRMSLLISLLVPAPEDNIVTIGIESFDSLVSNSVISSCDNNVESLMIDEILFHI